MNGIILFIGESFRSGCQGTRNRGNIEAYDEQIKASTSHICFIKHIIEKYKLNSISVTISSYHTQFNEDLISVYKDYLVQTDLYDDVIGFDTLFHKSIDKIQNIESYDFVFYIRIDIYLKQHFLDVFDPTINNILFPTICWYWDCRVNHSPKNNPRVNDTMMFIPKKYYKYIESIVVGHETWHHLIVNTDITCEDMDTVIHTYHDSDSHKDWNPLYYIVNRTETTTFHSEGHTFDKYTFL